MKQETVSLVCSVESHPAPLTFHWTFNNSGELVEVPHPRYPHASASGTPSVADSLKEYQQFHGYRLNYTPTTEMDYGTVACWASNQVGKQRIPCLFQASTFSACASSRLHVTPSARRVTPKFRAFNSTYVYARCATTEYTDCECVVKITIESCNIGSHTGIVTEIINLKNIYIKAFAMRESTILNLPGYTRDVNKISRKYVIKYKFRRINLDIFRLRNIYLPQMLFCYRPI